MKIEDSPNKIKSVYNHKPKLLLEFKNNFNSEKKHSKYNIIYNSRINKFNSISIDRPKSSINNAIIEETKFSNPNFKQKKTISQEILFWDKKHIFPPRLNIQDNLVKKNNVIYSLRKLFIILPNDIKQMHTKLYPTNLNFEFYFPIRIINSTFNVDFIKNSAQNDILCDDLNHILYEVYKYLKLSIYDTVKMELYDEKFHPIVQESQLFVNKKRFIYAKISYLDKKKNKSWQKRIDSKLFPLNDDYLIKQFNNINNKNKIPCLYRDASTEYNKKDIQKKHKSKSVGNKVIIKNASLKINKNLNINLITNNNSILINKDNASKKEEDKFCSIHLSEAYEDENMENIIKYKDNNNYLSLKKNGRILNSYNNTLFKKTLSSETKFAQDNFNTIYNTQETDKDMKLDKKFNSNNNSKSINYNSLSNDSKNLRENNRIKETSENKQKSCKNNILINIIKRNQEGVKGNTLISPLLFNFDVTDIINNKYVVQYLSYKNKEKFENNIFQIKCKNFKIKNISNDDSNSHHKKSNNIIKNQKRLSKNKNIIKKSFLNSYITKSENISHLDINNDNDNENEKVNEEIIKAKMDKNLSIFCDLNNRIKDFITNEIDYSFTNEETDDYKSLKCNYILINELKGFPIYKLKKQFLLLSCLSQKMISKYEDLIPKMTSILLDKNDNVKNIFKLNGFDKLLEYLNVMFTNIKSNKRNLFRYIGSTNNDLKVPYLFLVLFVIYNKTLIRNNADKILIYLSLECAEIEINSEINFQQYCNYRLLMTRNKYINYHKKYNYIKDLILRVLLKEKFNKDRMIERLKTIFEIDKNDIKNILNNDMCTVKLKKNINIYNKIEEIYDKLINYYNSY